MYIGGQEVRRNIRYREQHGRQRYTVKREKVEEVGRCLCAGCVFVWRYVCMKLCVRVFLVLKTTDHPELARKNRLYGRPKSKA